jgi:hypothetical protein
LSLLKKEKELKIEPNVNSFYKPIEREEKVSKPFKVNRHIEERLPFQFKNKSVAIKHNLIDKQRVAIIKEQKAAKVRYFLYYKILSYLIFIFYLDICRYEYA